MNSYVFSQNVNYPSYLTTQIQGLGLSSTLDHIDTDSETSPMTVTIWFITALSDADQTTLNNYMESYTDPFVTQNSINAILSALNTDANVIALARVRMANVIPSMDVLILMQICTLLGINPHL